MYSDVVRRSTAVRKPLSPEELAVHDDRLEHLGHHRPLAAVQDVLLLLGQDHLVGTIGVVLLQAGIGTRAGQAVRDGIALIVDTELVAVYVVVRTRVVVGRVRDTETFGAAAR